ncbi:hypothetical protein [Aquimarina sp. I32.4]|uniref:hypothetical protein n=1 Tax=Aquimarina sp. I32.4 TaxID=2053903 RepID=UPI000CDEAE99|nr:hypothetical protein [Aquimarina sp. I32.4]
MKLNKEIKGKIDNFFANITAEELYDISIRKYGFIEDNSVEVTCERFDSVKVEIYFSSFDESYNNNDDKERSFALAA